MSVSCLWHCRLSIAERPDKNHHLAILGLWPACFMSTHYTHMWDAKGWNSSKKNRICLLLPEKWVPWLTSHTGDWWSCVQDGFTHCTCCLWGMTPALEPAIYYYSPSPARQQELSLPQQHAQRRAYISSQHQAFWLDGCASFSMEAEGMYNSKHFFTNSFAAKGLDCTVSTVRPTSRVRRCISHVPIGNQTPILREPRQQRRRLSDLPA